MKLAHSVAIRSHWRRLILQFIRLILYRILSMVWKVWCGQLANFMSEYTPLTLKLCTKGNNYIVSSLWVVPRNSVKHSHTTKWNIWKVISLIYTLKLKMPMMTGKVKNLIPHPPGWLSLPGAETVGQCAALLFDPLIKPLSEFDHWFPRSISTTQWWGV